MSKDAHIFEQTEAALNAWGEFRRRTSARLSMPTISPIAQMIDQVKVFEQQRKGVKKPLKRSRIARKDPDADAKTVSLEMRHSEPPMPANRESPSSRKPAEWPSMAMRVEAGINRACPEHRIVLIRSYLYRQPDRKAAQDLRIRREDYRLRRIAAVAWLADYLIRRGGLGLAQPRGSAL